MIGIILAFQSAQGDTVVNCARQQLGKPYVYGAAGPNSFDCSGLVQYCYRQIGRSLTHSATAQCNSGSGVSEGGAQGGDLVCFGQGGAYHVGIFVQVGAMIAAPKPGDVVKQQGYNWDSHYFRRLI